MSSFLPEDVGGIGRAWLALSAALAVHVADEAVNGFLSIYNPTAEALRTRMPWLPVPVFRFEWWLFGLVLAVMVLILLSAFAFRGAHWIRPIAYVLSIVMTANALGHMAGTLLGRTVETVRFDGPMPGVYSSPLLLGTSLYLLYRLWHSRPASGYATS